MVRLSRNCTADASSVLSQGLASHLLVAVYDEQLPGTGLKETAALAVKLYWAQYALNQIGRAHV